MDERVARLTATLRERLESLGAESRTAVRPPPRRRPPAGFDRCITPHGAVWKRLDFVSAPPCDAEVAGTAYFDIETSGLSSAAGTLIFSAAVARPVFEGGLEIVQLFLGEPGLESAFLHSLVEELESGRRIATYNGRRFDLPILKNRLLLAGLAEDALAVDHLDLLDLTRPLLRAAFGSCALRNVEYRLLDFAREDDLPSHLVPEAYFEYLRCGTSAWLDAALAHNRQDVISLYHLQLRLLERLRGRDQRMTAAELLALARFNLRRARTAEAVRNLREAVWRVEGTPSADAAQLLATLLLRRGRPQTADRVLAWAEARMPDAVDVSIARAKLLEWHFRELRHALSVVELALSRLPRQHALREPLAHREARLRRRLARAHARERVPVLLAAASRQGRIPKLV